MHNLEATVFVYEKDGEIKAVYLDEARWYDQHPEWSHIATLEPRMWIENVLNQNKDLRPS